MEKQDPSSAAEELTTDQKRENVIRLAFGGSQEQFDRFVDIVRQAIPPGTGVILRGSAVTGQRWKDGAPFDSDGPGTSDLDLTLVGGDEVMALYKLTGFFVPGVHSRPLSEEDPDIAPTLVPLAEAADGHGPPPGEYPGIARRGHLLSRRAAGAALPDVD